MAELTLTHALASCVKLPIDMRTSLILMQRQKAPSLALRGRQGGAYSTPTTARLQPPPARSLTGYRPYCIHYEASRPNPIGPGLVRVAARELPTQGR